MHVLLLLMVFLLYDSAVFCTGGMINHDRDGSLHHARFIIIIGDLFLWAIILGIRIQSA